MFGPVFLPQRTSISFSARWSGATDGSGTLSGEIAGVPFALTQGPTMEEETLNGFGIGSGFASNDDPTLVTGPCYFDELSFSLKTQ
jgi:hypothetical protein